MIDLVKNNPTQSALVAVVVALSGGVTFQERNEQREIDAIKADMQLLKEKLNWVLTNEVNFLTTIAPSASIAAAPPPPMEITLDSLMIEEAADAVEEAGDEYE